MKTWKRWIARICRMEKEVFKGNLDTEEILRVKNRRIIELEQENAGLKSRLWHPKLVHVEIDQAGQKQAQSQIGAYEPPERTTDKPGVVLHNTRGRYAQQRWPEFRKTHLMPTVKRPPQDDLFTSAEMTAVRIPTWLL